MRFIRPLVAIAAVGLMAGCGSSPDAASPKSTTPAPAPVTEAATTPPVDASLDSVSGADFPVGIQVGLGSTWQALTDVPATLGFVHLGTPPGDQSQWWGPGVINVEGARIHDPSSAVSDQPAKPSLADFVSWPDDLFAYVS